MRFRFSFVVTDAAAFTAMINPYDFDNAEIMRVQDQGTGVFEICVFAFEKDLAQLEKLAAQFA